MPTHMPRGQAVEGSEDRAVDAPTDQPSVAFDISTLLAKLQTMFGVAGARAGDDRSRPRDTPAAGAGPATPMLDQANEEAARASGPRHDWDMSLEGAGSSDAAHDSISGYESLLDRERSRLARQAAADPNGQAAVDHRLQSSIEAGYTSFSQLEVAGTTAPTPYMVNYTGGAWAQRKGSRARRLLYGTDEDGKRLVDNETLQWAGIGKASAEQMHTVLTAIVKHRLWEKLPRHEKARFDAALARILPESAPDEVRAAASALAYAEVAGVGTDCSGYVQHVLVKTGVLPAGMANEIKSMTGAQQLTSGLGTKVSTWQRGASGPVPLDADGNLSVRPGDTVRIDNGGHIGVVHDAVDTGKEIVIRYSHSTPNQEVHGAESRIATTPEGVRLDIIAWDKATRRWKAVRSAFSSKALNGGVLNGFYRLDRDKVTRSAKGWMGTQDPWSVGRDTQRHGP